MPRTGWCAPTREGCAGGSTSAPAWSAVPSCSCSTSRQRAATRGLVADGTDVLLTTQYLEEADQLARQIVIIDHGRVIAAGTPEQLKERSGGDVIVVRPRAAEDLPAVEEALRSV